LLQSPLRRIAVLLTTVIATVTALVGGVLVAPASAAPVPTRMAVLGDSITRGFNACGWYVDCTSRSWAGGSDSGVNSHYLRLRALNGSLVAYNDAASGARVNALAGQAASAVSQRADYVTVLIGANDACTSSESAMTSVADFETRFRAAMDTLSQGVPNSLIFVSSIPDVKRLWQVGKDNFAARSAWSLFGICQSLLANPTSTAAADVARRDRVRARVVDFNGVLAEVCAERPTCRFDGNVVFSYPFQLSQVSGWDYFHPNAAGQTVLAAETYKVGFWSAAATRTARKA
jgi:lysophospholipase L1-like esterase